MGDRVNTGFDHRDESFMKKYLQDAYQQGCRCVILTVDAPVMGNREKDVENGCEKQTVKQCYSDGFLDLTSVAQILQFSKRQIGACLPSHPRIS